MYYFDSNEFVYLGIVKYFDVVIENNFLIYSLAIFLTSRIFRISEVAVFFLNVCYWNGFEVFYFSDCYYR